MAYWGRCGIDEGQPAGLRHTHLKSRASRWPKPGGFTDIEVSPWRGEQYMGSRGSDPQVAARFATEALPFGEALSELEPDVRRRAQGDIEAVFGPGGVKRSQPWLGWSLRRLERRQCRED